MLNSYLTLPVYLSVAMRDYLISPQCLKNSLKESVVLPKERLPTKIVQDSMTSGMGLSLGLLPPKLVLLPPKSLLGLSTLPLLTYTFMARPQSSLPFNYKALSLLYSLSNLTKPMPLDLPSLVRSSLTSRTSPYGLNISSISPSPIDHGSPPTNTSKGPSAAGLATALTAGFFSTESLEAFLPLATGFTSSYS
jgi:hypothetical protein